MRESPQTAFIHSGLPSGPESGAGAPPQEGLSEVERWKREASFFEAELARRSQLWEEREQELISGIDMRDAELTALEHRVRNASLDSEASNNPVANSEETDRLRARAGRAEEHVMRLGEMLASVCRQESQLVVLLASAREQLRHAGLADVIDEPSRAQTGNEVSTNSKTGLPQRQPLATNNTGVTDGSHKVASAELHLQTQAQRQVTSRHLARQHLCYAAKEAASLEHQVNGLQGTSQLAGVTKFRAPLGAACP